MYLGVVYTVKILRRLYQNVICTLHPLKLKIQDTPLIILGHSCHVQTL